MGSTTHKVVDFEIRNGVNDDADNDMEGSLYAEDSFDATEDTPLISLTQQRRNSARFSESWSIHEDQSLGQRQGGERNRLLRGSSLYLNNMRRSERNLSVSSSRHRRPSIDSSASSRRIAHTRGENFVQDALSMAEGTIPQSVVLAFVIGTCCGVAAFVYYTVLEFMLEFLWHTLPKWWVVGVWPEELYVLWIPLVGLVMSLGVGLSVKYLGEPGDLAYTILCVHEKAYISMDHVMPMICASLFSILGGASLGPEAPLVAICASLGGFISRRLFRQRCRNVVRKHTLMGMAGALAAFFGVPLGGSIFALEVCSRFGVEYFEHLVEAIFCGEVCLVVFRTLSGLQVAPIWDLGERLGPSDPWVVVTGGLIGLLGAAVVTLIFAPFHTKLMAFFECLGLLDNEVAIWRAFAGATVILGLGVLVPHSMFWAEMEFQTIATMSPADTLPHVWPTSGVIGFEMDSPLNASIVGLVKIICISFSVAAGYRGGFIFPLFGAGAAFGNALLWLFPSIPLQLSVLCFAAGVNVAVTRTALATTLILSYLSAEQNSISAVLAASLCSLFATSYLPFIKTQIVRSDIDHSLFFRKKRSPQICDSISDFDFVDDDIIPGNE